jgi:nitroimidazol reductase NimA-like FMN-containing flavoprotein (pyridoxamine 5'-phosphate oxidase superfamily)
MAAKGPSPRMTPDEIWEFVTNAHTGVLTTLRRDGVPIALPLWFVCLDRTIYSRTRGKKLQRIAHDPRASFLVESGERWADLKAVHLTGRAEVVDLDEATSARVLSELDRKYSGFTSRVQMPKETADYYANALTGVVRFTPHERVLNWDNAKITGG